MKTIRTTISSIVLADSVIGLGTSMSTGIDSTWSDTIKI